MSLPTAVIAWTDPQREALAARVIGAMRHPWIADYGIGFAPPLTRFSPALVAALPAAKSAFDKLEIYARHVLLDVNAQIELARKHVALRARLHGPIDVLEVSERSADALDLELRLHHPSTAPAAVARDMREAGIDLDAFPARERLGSRFLVRLDDPFGAILAQKLGVSMSGLVLEHRVWPEASAVWEAFGLRQTPALMRVIREQVIAI